VLDVVGDIDGLDVVGDTDGVEVVLVSVHRLLCLVLARVR
jgi:hypothetical protein